MFKRFDEVFRNIMPILGFAIALGALLTSIAKGIEVDENLLWLLITILISLLLIFIYFTVRVLKKNPTSITISLIGYPGTGKTVYLTMLFEELQKARRNEIQFAPYGKETIERVMKDLSILKSRAWLPRTPYSDLFYYRAYATISQGLFLKRYKLEIADFAGEHFDELNPQKDKWLHRGKYFEYSTESDAIILMIDSDRILNQTNYDEIINGYIAAIQILAERKGAIENKKIQTPIAILFSKADTIHLVGGYEEIEKRASRLINICKNRSNNVHTFFVFAVGQVEENEVPKNLAPQNVTEPIEWLLRKV